MIRLFISERVSLAAWAAAAQPLVPKPGFTEKRERVQCGRMSCVAKTFFARLGCRRVQTGGFVGLLGAFKVVCVSRQVRAYCLSFAKRGSGPGGPPRPKTSGKLQYRFVISLSVAICRWISTINFVLGLTCSEGQLLTMR